MGYKEKLLDPRWQKKRLEIFERDAFACRYCGDKSKTLHVHHLKYDGDPWDVPEKYLLTVCEECHQEEHENRRHMEDYLLMTLRTSGASNVDVDIIATIFEEMGDISVINKYFMRWINSNGKCKL